MNFARLPLRGLLTTLVLFACEAEATPQPPAPPAVVAPTRFRPAGLADRAGGAVEEVRDQLARGDASGARTRAEEALAGLSDDVLGRPRLAYLAARAAAASGAPQAALPHLAAFESLPNHPLAAYAAILRAELLAPSDATAALTALEVPSALDFPARDRALRLAARLRLAAGDHEGAREDLLRVAESAEGDVLAEVATPLFEDALASDDASVIRRVLAVAHRVYARAPRTAEGHSAEARMRALANRLETLNDAGTSDDPPAARPTLDERIERAERLASGRVEDVVSAYEAILDRMDAGDPRRCAMRFGRAKALERARDKRRAAAELLSLATDCDDPEIRGFSLYKAGKALAALDADDEAAAAYARLPVESPHSRFADDAAVALARLHLAHGRAAEARAALESAVALPAGDLRGEAYFMLGFEDRKAGDLERAERTLRAALEANVEESGEENVGRIAYWHARTLFDLGRRDDALAAYEALARRAPLTYYGLSAHSRLVDHDGARAERVREALLAAGDEVEISMPGTMDMVAFSRAAELLLVGERDAARAELTRLGLLGEGASDEGVYLAASLYVLTHQANDAVELLRRRLASQRSAPPIGVVRSVLRLGYPRAFAPLVDEAATAAGVPIAFVRAIAREESSFDPTAVSRADAVGLIQILPSTARGFARDVGVEPTVERLKDARTNLAFGTRFMARLFRRFEANPALVPAAYNAGHGAVERWLRADSSRPFDQFVEEIPYEETRRYTRRVLQSYGVYAVLDEGRVPVYGATLPSR